MPRAKSSSSGRAAAPSPRKRTPRSKKAHASKVRDFAVEVGQLLADRKCDDIRVFDVAELSQVCDYIVIASGTSDRQMKSVGAEVADLGDERDMSAFRRDADAAHTWVLIDCVHVVVHLFEPNQRLYYDLESLWSDAEAIDWRRADQKKTHRHEGEIGLGASDDDANA